MKKYKDLITPFEESALTSWVSEYPRPQMRRDSYLSLCGEWELFDVKKGGKAMLLCREGEVEEINL